MLQKVEAKKCYHMDGTIALMLIEALLILLVVSISKAIRFISPSLYGNQPVAVDDSSKDDVILVSPPATKYDVFLSFRGEDTRHTFASYLYKGLRNAGIHTFMDHKLRKGERVSSVLLRKIEQSEISMIIFSENYASSTWCMNELVHILKCKKKFGRVVIPIFYGVDPSNIRKQNESFGNGFDVLKQRFKEDKKKLHKWRKALIQSAGLSGWVSNDIRPEFELVEEIVKGILSKLKYKSSSYLERLIGIADHIENIEKLLSEARIVGIWGMGGAGKTTLAQAIFQELKAQFDAFSFVENVKEKLKGISLDELQQNCLKELLKDDINIYDTKSTFVKSRLQRKKILLILDDVDNSIIAQELTKVCDWFGEGSRIIFTSRDEQVLKNAHAVERYHIPNLDFYDAFHLFNLKAFKQHEPFQGYMELSKSAVDYCQGNPLALVVLGCFLYGRGKEEWESALEKLSQDPPEDVVGVLKLSFDGLDDKQKNVFLDLAFFTLEGSEFTLNIIRQLYGSSAHIEISVLREKSLISVNNRNDYIVMHDLVRKMGLVMARQQLFSRRKTPVRLWRHEDIYDFFMCDKEIEAIRCMSLDASKMKRIKLGASQFRKMHSLIFLQIYKSDQRKPSKLDICENLDYLSEELRFFGWEGCPLSYVPLHLCAENLVTLDIRNSNIQQFGNGNQHFPNLKEILLSDPKHLIALPDFSYAPKIERMYLDGCEKFTQIYSSSVLGETFNLAKVDSGPVQINVGGSIKGKSSGLVIVHTYLDLLRFSFHKLTLNLLVCGKIMSGVRFKHVVMPLAERPEFILGMQIMTSLLPFLRKLHWIESPIEFGDDFKQHYTYSPNYTHHHFLTPDDFVLKLEVGGDRLRIEMINDNQREIINDHQVVMTSMEDEEEEDDELTMEYCGGNSVFPFTRLPNSVTRWSLLWRLTLSKSEIIGNADCSIAELILLKLQQLFDDYCKRIKPHLDVKLSFDIPSSPSTVHSLGIFYNLDKNQHHDDPVLHSFRFGCHVNNYWSLDSNYDDLLVQYHDWS